jgi:hypothetical protein
MGFMDDDRMIKFQNVKTLDQNIFPQFFSWSKHFDHLAISWPDH